MKLKTNLFLGKKPSLEEGQMIYTVHDEDNDVTVVERSRSCRVCLQFAKVIFYTLLLFFILFLVWIALTLVSDALAPVESRSMCGTGLFRDYLDPMDSDRNETEIGDMLGANFD